MASVKLSDVCKVYQGHVKAVKDFNLDIKDGEFVVFVGPSGCGKSTTLRMIAGLEDITSGKIMIDDKVVNNLESRDRDIAMVFQNYALYPHMSVYDNLSYSLKCHHASKEEIKEKVEHVSKLLGIEEYLERKPKELSGGQRQRVALGRCIIRNPKVFLFDEPLSNLDAKLRVAMRSEISKLHKQVNGTFIYVTHDQTEAMTMGDRIVVMKDGVIQQCDTPVNLYEHPINIFVATFLGSPQMNILKAKLLEDKIVLNDQLSIGICEKIRNKLLDGYVGKEVRVGIRPSDFTLGTKDDYDIHIEKIDLVEKLGNETLFYFNIDGQDGQSLASLKLNITDNIEGDLYLKIEQDRIHLFNEEGESILRINDFNYIKEHFVNSENGLIIGKKFNLKDFNSRCVYDDINNEFDGFVKISTHNLTLNKTSDDDFELDSTVVACDARSHSFVYFAKLEDGTRITFETDKTTVLKVGEKVKLYCEMNCLEITDENKNILTINENVIKPLREEEIVKRGNNYYVTTSDKNLYKIKYLVVKKIYDLGNIMLLNVADNKDNILTLKVQRNPDYYNGLILYTKKKKVNK